jgi:hypothetical protein
LTRHLPSELSESLRSRSGVKREGISASNTNGEQKARIWESRATNIQRIVLLSKAETHVIEKGKWDAGYVWRRIPMILDNHSHEVSGDILQDKVHKALHLLFVFNVR